MAAGERAVRRRAPKGAGDVLIADLLVTEQWPIESDRIYAIAAAHGMCEKTIRRAAQRAGITRRRFGLHESTRVMWYRPEPTTNGNATREDEMVPAQLAHADEHVQCLRQVVQRHQRILVVGGPAGFYGRSVQNDNRVMHFVSEESKSKHANFTLPARVGAVLLTRFLAHRLSDAVIAECKRLEVPVFGVFRSPGAVSRLLARTLDWTHYEGVHGKDEMSTTLGEIARITEALPPDSVNGDGREEEIEVVQQKITSVRAAVTVDNRPVLVKERLSDADQTEANLREMFEDVRAALQLAEDTAIAALRRARESEAAARENLAAAQVLDQLRGLLTVKPK